jgi:predicted RNA binding protein YcfA (HicA-like mRNA interferase family)
MYKYNYNHDGVSSSPGWIPLGLLRSVSGKEAIKAFLKAGGTVRHGKGDHVNIKMPNERFEKPIHRNVYILLIL